MSDLLTAPNLVAAVLVVALNAYVLFGGADFGGGVWDLLATGRRRAEQRALIADAIGPIWEANHVWLILVVVLLFTCFPPAFARLMTVLHIPLSLMLIGIVLRGSAFTFRTYDSQRDEIQRRWGRIFAVASTITPVLLGICIGAVAQGRVSPASTGAHPVEIFILSWMTPFAFSVGGLTLALFAYLAAVYLTVEARDSALGDDFRRRALGALAVATILAVLVLLVARRDAPQMHALLRERWALPLHLAAAVAAATAAWSLWTRRYRLARVAAAAQVSCILWGWAVAQYPFIIPRSMAIAEVAAPTVTLRLVLWTLLAGGLVLFPSLFYLFRIFKGEPGEEPHAALGTDSPLPPPPREGHA